MKSNHLITRKRFMARAASLVMAFMLAAPTHAVNFTNGNGNGLWTTTGNWDGVGSDMPLFPEGAIVAGNRIATHDGSASSNPFSFLIVGAVGNAFGQGNADGTGQLDVTGGSLVQSSDLIRIGVGRDGIVNVSGGTLSHIGNGNIIVGFQDAGVTGELNLSGTGTFATTTSVVVGQANGIGIVDVRDNSTLNVVFDMRVGLSLSGPATGTAIMNVSGGDATINIGGNLTFDRNTSELNVYIDDANDFSTINVAGAAGTGVNPLSLLTVDIGTNVSVNDSWVIINNTGAGSMQSITFAGAGTASFFGLSEGTTFTSLDGTQLMISYIGGSGNDLELVVVATRPIPEPATATLGLLGLGGLMMRRRRMA